MTTLLGKNRVSLVLVQGLLLAQLPSFSWEITATRERRMKWEKLKCDWSVAFIYVYTSMHTYLSLLAAFKKIESLSLWMTILPILILFTWGALYCTFNVKLCFSHKQGKCHFPFPKHQKAPFTVTEHNYMLELCCLFPANKARKWPFFNLCLNCIMFGSVDILFYILPYQIHPYWGYEMGTCLSHLPVI